MPAGHADHPRRRAAGGRDPSVLRPPAAGAGRGLPSVLRRGRGPAQAVHVVHHDRSRPGMVVRRRTPARQVRGRPGREPRVPAAEPPARLPDLRPRRRVPAAGPGARVRAGGEPLRRGQARLPEAAAAVAARGPRPRAVRPVRAVHALLRPDLAATGSSSCSRGAPPSRSGSRPARTSARRSAGTRSRSARSARSQRRRTGSSRGRSTSPSVDTVCPHCSAGCNIKLDMRRGEVVRQLARDNLEVNDAWLCDKGRFAFRFPDAPDRMTTPLIRDHGLEPASFGEVLDRRSPRGAPASASRS